MPSHSPVAATLIPKAAEPEIPTRVVSTRPRSTEKPAESVNQSSITETPVADSTPTAESVKLTPEATASARREQAYRQREAALKQREADLEQSLKDAKEYSSLKEKLKAKDFSAIEPLAPYEEYTQYKLGQPEPDPETEKFQKLETEIEGIKKAAEDKAEAEYKATVAEYGKEITSLVSSNPEFSSIKELKSEDAVLQYFLDEWESGNEDITVEQAAKDVEEFLVEEATKFASLTKIKSREPEPRKLPRPGIKTLTSQVNVGATPPSTTPLSKLPDSERYAEARRRAMAKREGK